MMCASRKQFSRTPRCGLSAFHLTMFGRKCILKEQNIDTGNFKSIRKARVAIDGPKCTSAEGAD